MPSHLQQRLQLLHDLLPNPLLISHARDTLGIKDFTLFGEVFSADPSELSFYTTTAKLCSLALSLMSSLSWLAASADDSPRPVIGLQDNQKSVITSYSIHYTKLYDPSFRNLPNRPISWLPRNFTNWFAELSASV